LSKENACDYILIFYLRIKAHFIAFSGRLTNETIIDMFFRFTLNTRSSILTYTYFST